MAQKGSTNRAEVNSTLRTTCANCGKSIPTEVGHAHPIDETLRRETWGLIGSKDGKTTVFPTCAECYDAGWKPPEFTTSS